MSHSQSNMRSPYTAGPWEAPRNGAEGAVYAPNAPAKTLWRICDGVRGLSDEELFANTRLISAAPALLALAQKAHEILAPMADCDPAIREWLMQFQRSSDQVDGHDRHWLLPFVVDELADDGSDMDSPQFFDATDEADALRQYTAKCVEHGYTPAPRTRVRQGVR